MHSKEERFSRTGLALNQEAKAKSRQTVICALEAWQNSLPEHSPLRIFAGTGSFAKPNKSPRLGIYPSTITYEQAATAERYKNSSKRKFPSDVDITVRMPMIPEVRSQARQLSKHIFETHRVLIQPHMFDDRLRNLTMPLGEFQERIKRS